MNRIQMALAGLSDVDGVVGSFVITETGTLLGTNLPAAFDAEVFAEAGPRLVRLVEAGAGLSEGLRGCVLKFPEHKLFVKDVSGALLGVLLDASASLPALRVATNLVGRKLAQLVKDAPPVVPHVTAEASAAPPPVTARSSAPAASAAPPVASAPPQPTPSARPIYYRGHRVS